MTLDPKDLMLFASVVDHGGFSRAAERVGLPKSTVSRRVSALEAELGERLLLRTTRKLTLTDLGHSVLRHAHQVAAEVEAASSLAQQGQATPRGRLRLSMPADLANLVLAPLLARFAREQPQVSLEVDLSPRRVDLIGENFDMALRMGELADDATLMAHPVAVFSTGLYASPSYLAQRGEPPEPEALMEHDALRLLGRHGEPQPWVLSRGDARWEGVPPGRVTANSPELLLRLACEGLGLAAAGDAFAESYVREGRLRPVLADWRLPAVTAWAVFPGRRLMPARSRALLDALRATFEPKACDAAQHRLAELKARAAGGVGPALAVERSGSRESL